MSSIEIVVFDLDGTLIDSAPTVASLLNDMRAECGLGPIDITLYRKWSSVGGLSLVQRALGMDCNAPAKLAEFRARYRAFRTPLSSVFHGVKETLDTLKSQNIGMAICSNKPEHLAQKVLIETGLRGYFHSVIGGDTTIRTKPHRDPLDLSLKHFTALPSAAILVGDSSVDQRTAQAAAIPFVFFSSGYDDGVTAFDHKIAAIPDVLHIVDPSRAARIPGQVEGYG